MVSQRLWTPLLATGGSRRLLSSQQPRPGGGGQDVTPDPIAQPHAQEAERYDVRVFLATRDKLRLQPERRLTAFRLNETDPWS